MSTGRGNKSEERQFAELWGAALGRKELRALLEHEFPGLPSAQYAKLVTYGCDNKYHLSHARAAPSGRLELTRPPAGGENLDAAFSEEAVQALKQQQPHGEQRRARRDSNKRRGRSGSEERGGGGSDSTSHNHSSNDGSARTSSSPTRIQEQPQPRLDNIFIIRVASCSFTSEIELKISKTTLFASSLVLKNLLI